MANLVSTLDSTGNLLLGNYGTFDEVSMGEYSMGFNGISQYLTVANNAAFTLGSGDFTMECWIYLTGYSAAYSLSTYAAEIISKDANASNSRAFNFQLNGTATSWTSLSVNLFTTNTTLITTTANYSFSLNTWYHVAVVRQSGTVTFYVNGVSIGGGSNATNIQTTASAVTIGYENFVGVNNYEYYFPGFMSNLRVVKGTAVYTSDFIPLAPLPVVSGTSLLTGQGPTITDSSTNAFTITNVGGVTTNTAIVPYSSYVEVRQYANGIHQISGSYDEVTLPDLEYSTLFNGSGNYLSTPSSTSFDFGTNDFTIEAWIYPIDAGRTADASKFGGIITQYVSASITNSWYFGIGISGGVFSSITFNSSDVTRVNATGLSYALNTWYHVACVRYSGTMTIYINGVSVGSASYSSAISYNASASVNIGRSAYADLYENWLRGYISNARIVKGTAVYTSNFTPPTQTLVAIANTSLLTCQNSTFVDNSNNNFAITNTGSPKTISFPVGYCNSFNGSGQYLTVASNTALQLTTGDFTIEGWIYTNSFTNSPSIYYKRATRTIFAHVGIGTISAGRLALLVSNAAGSAWTINDSSSMPVMSANTWYHFALVRNGNNIQMYLNGTQYINSTAITSATTIRDDGSAVSIGAAAADGGGISLPYDGYISNLRIVKGTALYANTGFIPSLPLTAVGNTVLLTCQSPTIIDNSPNAFSITNTGNVSVLYAPVNPPQRRQYPDGSCYISGEFDEIKFLNNSYSASLNGSTQYFTVAGSSTKFGFGTGDFTVEFWVYPTALGSRRDFIDMGDGTVSGPLIWFDGSGGLQYYLSSTRITASGVLTTNKWHHIALSRSAGSSRLFINGLQGGSTYADTINYSGTGTVHIGRNQGAAVGFVAGYMSNLRILKGTGAYTANFTPSLSPLTTIANTTLLTLQNSTIRDNSIYAANLSNIGPVTTIVSTLPFV